MELICSPTLRAPLIIGIVMQLSQQLSGINAVFYYSTTLFMSSGLTEESAKYATIGIGCIMVSGAVQTVIILYTSCKYLLIGPFWRASCDSIANQLEDPETN